MTRLEASLGTAAFFVMAPGVVAGLIPWLITHWRSGDGASATYTWIGAILIALSLAVLIESFVRFARNGGTPAPPAPTTRLVVEGLYRFVRNPMYIAVLGLIFGQMFLFAHAALLAYGVTMAFVFHLFVYFYEEPTLRIAYPEAFEAYCAGVHRWLPRLTPWRAAEDVAEIEGG